MRTPHLITVDQEPGQPGHRPSMSTPGNRAVGRVTMRDWAGDGVEVVVFDDGNHSLIPTGQLGEMTTAALRELADTVEYVAAGGLTRPDTRPPHLVRVLAGITY